MLLGEKKHFLPPVLQPVADEFEKDGGQDSNSNKTKPVPIPKSTAKTSTQSRSGPKPPSRTPRERRVTAGNKKSGDCGSGLKAVCSTEDGHVMVLAT